MKLGSNWLILETVGSTQNEAALSLLAGSPVDVVFAHNQLHGRGRFGRDWRSNRGESLTMSLVFSAYESHSRPWLIGMSCAAACAEQIGCQVQWPNDLVMNGKKLGGVLTEMGGEEGSVRVPIVGIGINVTMRTFPAAVARTATSVSAEKLPTQPPLELAQEIVNRIGAAPEPTDWRSIETTWRARDATVGKRYKDVMGEVVTALGIDDEGCLIVESEHGCSTVYAAEAFFGRP